MPKVSKADTMTDNKGVARRLSALPAEVREKVWRNVEVKAWPRLAISSANAAANIRTFGWPQVCFVGVAMRPRMDEGRLEVSLSLKTSMPDLSLSAFTAKGEFFDERWGSFYNIPVNDLAAAFAYLTNHLPFSNIGALVIEMEESLSLESLEERKYKEPEEVGLFIDQFPALRQVILINVNSNLKGMWRVRKKLEGIHRLCLVDSMMSRDTHVPLHRLQIPRIDTNMGLYKHYIDDSPFNPALRHLTFLSPIIRKPDVYFLEYFSNIMDFGLGEVRRGVKWVGMWRNVYYEFTNRYLPPIIVLLREHHRSLRFSGLALEAREEKKLVRALSGMLETGQKERVEERWGTKANGVRPFHLRIHLANDTATLHLKGRLKLY